MNETYYFLTIIAAASVTFYFTRKHYYNPLSSLPIQSSTDPISVPSKAINELKSPQESINDLVTALNSNQSPTFNKKQSSPQPSWLGMNETTKRNL